MTEAPDSTGQPDAAHDALISLVIRGMVRGAPDDATKQLVEQGFAITKGPITMATPQGTAEAGKLLRVPPGSEKEQEIDKLFDGFLPINRRLRDVCSAWQTRPDGTPNDHSDAIYDDGIRERLDEVHSSIGPILRRLGAASPRLAGYRPRLQAALDKFEDGEAFVAGLAADGLISHGVDAHASGIDLDAWPHAGRGRGARRAARPGAGRVNEHRWPVSAPAHRAWGEPR